MGLSPDCPDTHKSVDLQLQTMEESKLPSSENSRQQVILGRTDSSPFSDPEIHRVPFEIIGYIFEFYVEDVADDQNHSSAPFLLGAVCQRWRRVAWKTPSLWATLFFRLEDNSQKVEPAIEWLQRSGDCPLYITLHNASKGPDGERQIFPLVIFINQHLHRCRHLDLQSFSSRIGKMWSPVKQPSLLQTLRILQGFGDYYSPLNFGPLAAPTKLELTNIGLRSLTINLSNLTHFTGSSVFLRQLLDLLALAPQLTTFCVRGVVIHKAMRIDDPDNPRVRHLHLQHVSFEVYEAEEDSDAAVAFFYLTTLPKLKTCDLRIQQGFPTESFLDFLGRSSCSITSFSISYGSISSGDLTRIAMVQPSIISLNISPPVPHVRNWRRINMESFYYALGQDNAHNTALLPSLQHISFFAPTFIPWSLVSGFRFRAPAAADIPSTSPGRADLLSITGRIFVLKPEHHHEANNYHEVIGSALISDWRTLCELIELKKSVSLKLEIEIEKTKPFLDVLELSYAVKSQVAPQNVPEHILESDLVKTWSSKSSIDSQMVEMIASEFMCST